MMRSVSPVRVDGGGAVWGVRAESAVAYLGRWRAVGAGNNAVLTRTWHDEPSQG
jgi:hypothetical protein